MPAVACVVLVGALGACGSGTPVAEPSGDVTATAEPTPTVTPSPEPSPSQTDDAAPPRPAAMDRTDGEGAAAAAQYFMSLYEYVNMSQDLSEWSAITFPTCEFCEKTRGVVEGMASSQSHLEGGEITSRVVTTYEMDTLLGGYPLDVEVTQGPARIVDATGAVTNETAGSTGVLRVEVVHDGTMWRLVEAGILP